MGVQIPLSISLRDEATFDNFYAGNNTNVLNCLQAFLKAGSEHFIYICGATASGRTHLLQACCHATGEQAQTAVYLPLKEKNELSSAMLDGLEQVDLIAIDDVHCIAENSSWEEALFHCYNRAREQGKRLIVSGNVPPKQLSSMLADLQSRLSWGLVFQMQPLSDEQMVGALQMRASHRGMNIAKEVALYLMNHCRRDMNELIVVLDKLDRESLIHQRRITIPFVKRLILSE